MSKTGRPGACTSLCSKCPVLARKRAGGCGVCVGGRGWGLPAAVGTTSVLDAGQGTPTRPSPEEQYPAREPALQPWIPGHSPGPRGPTHAGVPASLMAAVWPQACDLTPLCFKFSSTKYGRHPISQGAAWGSEETSSCRVGAQPCGALFFSHSWARKNIPATITVTGGPLHLGVLRLGVQVS